MGQAGVVLLHAGERAAWTNARRDRRGGPPGAPPHIASTASLPAAQPALRWRDRPRRGRGDARFLRQRRAPVLCGGPCGAARVGRGPTHPRVVRAPPVMCLCVRLGRVCACVPMCGDWRELVRMLRTPNLPGRAEIIIIVIAVPRGAESGTATPLGGQRGAGPAPACALSFRPLVTSLVRKYGVRGPRPLTSGSGRRRASAEHSAGPPADRVTVPLAAWRRRLRALHARPWPLRSRARASRRRC